jgi:hypothetical protein
MSSRSLSDIQTGAEGERWNANVLTCLKTDPSYEFIGEVMFQTLN